MSFESSELKLRRAKHHIDNLQRSVPQLLRRHRKIVIQDNEEAGQRSTAIVGDEPIQDTFAILIGEALYNLRCTLDHLVWEVVAPHIDISDENTVRSVQYPFNSEPSRFVPPFANRKIDLAGPEIVRIIEDSKPYLGGNKYLYAIHALGNIDKHRAVIPAIQVIQFERMNLRDIDPSAPDILFSDGLNITGRLTWPLPKGNRQQRRAAGIPSNGAEINATLDILFDQREELAGERIVPALASMFSEVEKIVRGFHDAEK